MKTLRFIVGSLGLFLLLTSGCRTGVQLEEVNSSFKEIQKAIYTVIGKPREVSSDDREILSIYRDKKGRELKNLEKSRERVYTSVSILGVRRPFSIQVEVIYEMKNEIGQYYVVKKDEKEANLISSKIKMELAKSREGQSLIDDFKPF